jgi:hypothetical protein
MSDIERALDRLATRLQRIGARSMAPPPDTRALDELIAQIAPVSLPEAVETWWRRVDTQRLPIDAWPSPCDPGFALSTWRDYQEELVGVAPRCLVPVAYSSMVVLSVEADQPGAPAGEILRWTVDGPGSFSYVVPTWADLLECYVDVIDAGACEVRDGVIVLEHEILDGAIRARSSDVRVEDRFPGREMHFADASHWPARWQRSSGIDAGDRRPRGRTVTVVDVLATAPGTRVAGTIVGRVVGLAGTAGGCLATVDDGTGTIAVWCPAAVCVWGPTNGKVFELDIDGAGGSAGSGLPRELHRDVTSAALAGDLAAAQEAAAELAGHVGPHSAGTTATAIRPVD